MDSKLMVGAWGIDLEKPSDYEGDFCDWAEEMDFDIACEYYDASTDDTFYGYEIHNFISMNELNEKWMEKIKTLAEKFEKTTGVKAVLAGVRDIF